MNAVELQERLIDFSAMIINMTDKLPNTQAGKNFAGQLVRSSISVTLNYGEACGSESQKDFVHKLRLVLKELRETFVGLKLINKINLLNNAQLLD